MADFPATRTIRVLTVVAVGWSGLVAIPPAHGATAILVGAGDIASCSTAGDSATANLLASISGTIFTLGDNAYGAGMLQQFNNCYGPSWGRFKARTRPAPGNHEYGTPAAAGYFDYFGSRAGVRGKGWYSYTAGSWHVIVLNSNCSRVGCGKGSEQERWLRAELGRHGGTCTLAYFHHSRFSSDNQHGNYGAVGPFWEALYEYGADLVVSAHAHVYERFGPQTPWGKADATYGIRQIVAGTGGVSRYGFGTPKAHSQVRNASAFGVLKLTLFDGSYDWRFIPQAGKTFSDAGHGRCHGRP